MNNLNVSKIAKDLLIDARCKNCKNYGKWQVSYDYNRIQAEIAMVCAERISTSAHNKIGTETPPNKEDLQEEDGYCEKFELKRTR